MSPSLDQETSNHPSAKSQKSPAAGVQTTKAGRKNHGTAKNTGVLSEVMKKNALKAP